MIRGSQTVGDPHIWNSESGQVCLNLGPRVPHSIHWLIIIIPQHYGHKLGVKSSIFRHTPFKTPLVVFPLYPLCYADCIPDYKHAYEWRTILLSNYSLWTWPKWLVPYRLWRFTPSMLCVKIGYRQVGGPLSVVKVFTTIWTSQVHSLLL